MVGMRFARVGIGDKRDHGVMELSQFSEFNSAGGQVLDLLHGKLGFDRCVLVRVLGGQWTVVESRGRNRGSLHGLEVAWRRVLGADRHGERGLHRALPEREQDPAKLTTVSRPDDMNEHVVYPLHLRDGTLFGAVCAVASTRRSGFSAEQASMLELSLSLLSRVIWLGVEAEQQRRRADLLDTQARKDPLVDLYNRRAWDEFLEAENARCLRYGHRSAVMIVDLDDLKEVNDTQGHSAGDKMLIQTAELLSRVARSHDMVARLGGDEFGVVCVECDGPGAQAIQRRLEAALSENGISASIGLALRGACGSLTQAWEKADAAMYLVKSRRRRRAGGAAAEQIVA